VTRNTKNPAAYRRPCGWNALLPQRDATAGLSGTIDADVAVVGAGYTGIAAARRYAELSPSADVVLLEASTLGEGNPGRNSGFLLEVSLANDADPDNVERMRRCNALIGDTLQGIVRDARASGRDCGLVRSGTYRAAAGRQGLAAFDHYRRFLEAAALPFETLDREDLAGRIGTRFYERGLYSPHCWLAQPAALVRALATRLPETVRLYERSPALALRVLRHGFELVTPDGRVKARQVVLANNAFAKNLGIGASRLVAMYTYAGLTEPLDDEAIAGLGSDAQWGLLPAHRLGSTLRRTPDGRLLLRSLYGYEREADNASVERRLRGALARRFPALGDVRFASVWGGATGYTRNGAPLWGEVRPGLFVSAGCNGGGVVKGTLFGRLLAEYAHGLDVPDVGALFGRASWMPPEPFRRLGFEVIAGLERHRGRAEV